MQGVSAENAIAAPSPARGLGASLSSGFSPMRRGIAVRLLALILLFSSLITLLSAAVQLYFDFRRDVRAIEIRLAEIERTHLGPLAGALWHMDVDQLRLHLEGMLRLPDMRALEVRETASVAKPVAIIVGHRQDRAAISRQYDLVYDDRGVNRQVGTLYAEASLDDVYDRLFDQAVIILVSQGVKTFLVSLFTLYVVWRLVARHLIGIAHFVANYDIAAPAPQLRLDRTSPNTADELDQVVAAFNGLSVGLQGAYADLRQVNADLAADIVARREAEAEIIRLNGALEQLVRQRTAELEAANKELQAFSYSVSHDLRAPLRRIEGFSRILLEEYAAKLDERAHHCLDRIRNGTREMADMIDSFLKMSRSTRNELIVETVDLSAIAATVLGDLADKDSERHVRSEIAPGLVVHGDKRQLVVVMTNLLDNAWKYTRRTDDAIIAVGSVEVDGKTAYFVRDNGAGFDMAYVARLFTPFNRLHRPEDFEGSGIGLATVQRIVARHGGKVWAEGEPGRGATFYFTCVEGGEDECSDNSAG
jgi:signal transduction histidine kinase